MCVYIYIYIYKYLFLVPEPANGRRPAQTTMRRCSGSAQGLETRSTRTRGPTLPASLPKVSIFRAFVVDWPLMALHSSNRFTDCFAHCSTSSNNTCHETGCPPV